MLTPVHLDNQAILDRNEVDDVGTDRALTTEFIPLEPSVPQDHPQATLGVSRGSP